MFKDDGMIPILTAVVIMVAIGTLLPRVDGFEWLFGERVDQQTSHPAPAQTVALSDERVVANAGQLLRIDVLQNDLGIGVQQRRGLLVVQEPACGQVFVQAGALQYLASAQCVGRQEISYSVPGAPNGVVATAEVVVVGGEPATPPGQDTPAQQPQPQTEPVVATPRAPRLAEAPGSGAPVRPSGQGAALPARDQTPRPLAPSAQPPPILGPGAAPSSPGGPAIATVPDPVIALAPPPDMGPRLSQQRGPSAVTAGATPGAAPTAPELNAPGVVEVEISSPPEIAVVPQGDAPAEVSVGSVAPDVRRGLAPAAPSPSPNEDAIALAPGLTSPESGGQEPVYDVPDLGAPDIGATPFDQSPSTAPTVPGGGVRLAPAPVTAQGLGDGLAVDVVASAPTLPAPDPVLGRQDPGFRQAPSGSTVSGSPREWMRGSTTARSPADPLPRRLRLSELALNDASGALPRVMVAVVERLAPETEPPAELALGAVLEDAEPGITALQRPVTQDVVLASLPQPQGALAAAVLGAALGTDPLDRSQDPYVQPVPVPVPVSTGTTVAPLTPGGDGEVAAVPAPDASCVEPPSMTLDVRRAGRTIVSVVAVCHATTTAELRYAGLRVAMPLDNRGRGQVLALGFEPNSPAVLAFQGETSIDFDLPFKGMNRVSRIALVWDQPVDLELNAVEFGGSFGSDNHVRRDNPRSFKDVRRSGGGFLHSYRAAYGRGQNMEVYSFFERRGGQSGVVNMLVDYASRSRDRLQGTCGNGIYATPEFQVLRTLKGRPDRPAFGRLAAIDCSDVATETGDKRLIPGAIADLLIVRN